MTITTTYVRIEYAYPTSDLGGRSGAFIVYCGDDTREFPTVFPVDLDPASYSDAAKVAATIRAERFAVEWAIGLDRPVDAAAIEIAFGGPERANPWRPRGVMHKLDGQSRAAFVKRLREFQAAAMALSAAWTGDLEVAGYDLPESFDDFAARVSHWTVE